MRQHVTSTEIMSSICILPDLDKLPHITSIAPIRRISPIESYPTLSDFVAEQCKDPEFKKLYDRQFLILDVGIKIFKARKKLGLTQAELALKAGTTQPVIARIEGGNSSRMPSLDLLAKIANAMECEVKISFS